MNFELKITLWALAFAYAVLNSIIYSWTFWNVFEINILQFASFTEILPSIIYTLLPPCILMIIGFSAFYIWESSRPQIGKKIDDTLSVKIKSYKSIKFWTGLILNLLKAIFFIIVSFQLIKNGDFSFDFIDLETIIVVGPIIPLLIVTSLIIHKTNFLKSIIKGRMLVIIILCFTPYTSYFFGHITAKKIMGGINTSLVESDSECMKGKDVKYRYIASISDKAFVMSLKDGSICVFKYNFLKLTSEKKKEYQTLLSANSI